MNAERPLHQEEEADREIPVYRLKDYLPSLEERFELDEVVESFRESLGTKQALTAQTARFEVAPGVYWEYAPPEFVKFAGTSLPKSSEEREKYLSKLPDRELKDGHFSVVEVIEKGGKLYRHGRYFANCDEFLDTLIRPDEARDIQKNTTDGDQERERFFKTLRKESRDWYEKSSLLAAMSEDTWEKAAKKSKQQPLLRRRRLSEVLYGSEGMMDKAIQEIIATFNYYVKDEKQASKIIAQLEQVQRKEKEGEREVDNSRTKDNKRKSVEEETDKDWKLLLTELSLKTHIPEKVIRGIRKISAKVLGGYPPEAFWTKRNLKQKFRDWYFVGKIEEEACPSDIAHVGTAVVEGIVSDLVMRQLKFREATKELKERGMIGDFPRRDRIEDGNLKDYMRIMGMAQANADPTLVHQLDPKGRKKVIDLAEIEYKDNLNKLESHGSGMIRFFYVPKGDSKPRFIDIPILELRIDGGQNQKVGAVVANDFSPGFTGEFKEGIHGLLEKILKGEEAEFTLPSGEVLQSHEFEDRNIEGMKTVLGSFIFHQYQFDLVENYSDILHSQGQAFVVTMEHNETEDGKILLKNVVPRLPHIIWEGKPASELLVDIGERIFANNKYEDLDFSLGEKREQKPVSLNGDFFVDVDSNGEPKSITYIEELLPMSSGNDTDDITLDPRKISKQFKRDTRVWWLALMSETGIEMGDGAETTALNEILEKYERELSGEKVKFQDSDFEFLPKLMDEVIARYVEKVAGADKRINASAILENEADRESLREAFEYAMFPPFFPTLVESFVASALYKSSVAVCVAPAHKYRLALAITKHPSPLPISRWAFSQAEAEGATQLINAQAAISDPLILAGLFGGRENILTKLNKLAMPEVVKWMSDPFLQHSSLGAAFAGAPKPVRDWLGNVFGFTTSSSEMGMAEPVMAETSLPSGKVRRGHTVHFQDELSRKIGESSRELTNKMFVLLGDLNKRITEYQTKYQEENNIDNESFLGLDIGNVLEEEYIARFKEEISLLKSLGLGTPKGIKSVFEVKGFDKYMRQRLQYYYVSEESRKWLAKNTSQTLKKARQEYLKELSGIYQESIIT